MDPLPLHKPLVVAGSKGAVYTVTRKHDHIYCTCPGWKYTKAPIQDRQCKHIMALLTSSSLRTPVNLKRSLPVETALAKRPREDDAFEVALATKWTTEDPTDWYWSEKLDGMRCFWTGHRLLSRNNIEIHAPAALLQQLPTTMRLDGELFLGRGRFQECVSIVRSHVPDVDRWTQIGFMVFDAPDLSLPFKQRIDKVNEALFADGWASAIEQHRCKGRADVERALAAVLALGGEGLVLRHPFKPYEGGRTGDLLKVKPMCDAECIVVGHEEGTGRNRGRMGALVCADEQSVIFRIGTGFKDAMRDHPPPIGTRVTYRYQEKTQAGKPRHPVFERIRPEE